ncbi:MAG: ATP-binding protein, partial [Pseudonocardiales bacterium]|nr:ATP-binding protein [Pseudonocardiales bacterium]
RFTGRAALIAQIDAYIESHRSGYVLIRGEAGVGKSTLAAHLVWNRWCVHHFTRIEGACSPEQARRSIAAQLISAWDLAEGLGLEEDFPAVADRPDWLVKVLRAAAQRRDELDKDLRVVLVIDGLDEADPPAPGRETGIPLGLPRPESLPDGVFVV